MSAMLAYRVYGQRAPQHRRSEDAACVYVPQDYGRRLSKGTMLAIADGMGGHNRGDVASKLAVCWMLRAYYADTVHDPLRSITGAMQIANAWIRYWSAREARLRGMATTLTAVAVFEHELVVVHLGDCCAYLVRGAQVWSLTQEQTWVAHALHRGLLTAQEARRHPWRNVLLGYLGQEKIMVEAQRFVWEPGDTLVLCSDGVGRFLSAREIAWRLRRLAGRTVKQLVRIARRRGSRDDATVIAARLDHEALAYSIAPSPRWCYAGTWLQ